VHHEFNFKENETLIGSVEPSKLGLVLELLRPKYNPRIVTIPAIFLIATTETEVRAYRRAMLAAEEYGRINLTLEANLPSELDDGTSHAVRLKIAKAKASKIVESLWSHVISAGTDWHQKPRTIYIDGWPQRFRFTPPSAPDGQGYNAVEEQKGYVIATDHTWQSQQSTQVFSSLGFEVLDPENPFPVLWRRLPKDDFAMLEHGLPFIAHSSIDSYKVTSILRDLGIDDTIIKARQ
jgi:hypothetical protein